MSKMQVCEIEPVYGETDLTLGISGGKVLLADGAVPVGWSDLEYTGAYSIACSLPDGDQQANTGFMPIAEANGTSSYGANYVVSQPPIGIEIVDNGRPEFSTIKISKSGVYLIYTAVSARTNGSSTPVEKIWSNAYVNGIDVRSQNTIYAPSNFALRTDSNNTTHIYHATGNDTWAGLLNEGDEVQFFYYAKAKTGLIRITGLVGSIIYVGNSE